MSTEVLHAVRMMRVYAQMKACWPWQFKKKRALRKEWEELARRI